VKTSADPSLRAAGAPLPVPASPPTIEQDRNFDPQGPPGLALHDGQAGHPGRVAHTRQVQILTFGALNGSFSSLNLPGLPPGESWRSAYSSSDFTLTVMLLLG
jgi:hypothetical protein